MYEIVTDHPLNPTKDCVLYKACEPVVDFEVATELLPYMHDHINIKGAYGIAANQIGVSLRIFSMKQDGKFVDFINPVITYFSTDTFVSEEGCLSYPDFFVKIRRSSKIELTWFDIHGKEQSGSYIDLWAKVIQHEMDYLNGLKFFDNATKYHMDAGIRQWKLARRRHKN